VKAANSKTTPGKFTFIHISIILVFLVMLSSDQYASAVLYDGSKAAISLTFEHAFPNQLTAINTDMTDMNGTVAVVNQRIGNTGTMTLPQLIGLQNRGFEIASHSETHLQISPTTSPTQLYYETVQSKIDLQARGFNVTGFIPPYNKETTASIALITPNYGWTEFFSPITYHPKFASVYDLNFSKTNYGIYNLPIWGVGHDDQLKTFADVKTQIDYAIANKLWIAIKFHEITTSTGKYDTSPAIFHDITQYVREQRAAGNLLVITRCEGVGLCDTNSTVPPTPPVTTASPLGGTYSTPQTVSLVANKPSVIHFAVNGDVTTSSETYSTPIQINNSSILKYFAVDTTGNAESIKTQVYTISSLVPSTITFDNSNNILCSSNPCSIPVTVGSGSNRMIIVAVTDEGYLNPVTSVDVTGGTSQGVLVGKKQVGSGSTEQNVEMWRIMTTNISDGANTVTLHFKSIPTDAGVSLMSFSGVKQQPEESEISNVITNNASIQTSIATLTDGSLIVSVVGNGQGGGTYTSHGTSQTERHDFAIPSAGQGVATEIKVTAGLDVQSHTYSKTSNRQAQYVASFAPAT